MIDVKELTKSLNTISDANTQKHTMFFGGDESFDVKIHKTIPLSDFSGAVYNIEKWCFYDGDDGNATYMPELMHCGLVIECARVFTNIDIPTEIKGAELSDIYKFLCEIDILDIIELYAGSQYKALINAVEKGVAQKLNMMIANQGVSHQLVKTFTKVQDAIDTFKELADSINLESLEGLLGEVQKSMTPENIKLVTDTLKVLG